MKLAPIADRLAKDLAGRNIEPLAIRDCCDMAAGGDLDCFQVDLLEKMVCRRLGIPVPKQEDK